MRKATIIYWTGTGNTKVMADAVAEGMASDNVEIDVISVEDATKDMVINSEILAFGCPSMGAEVLEEDEMEPFIESLSDVDFGGKKVGLFGSYDWGDGEWMRDWQNRMIGYGADMVGEGLIAHLTPDEDAIEECMDLGSDLLK